MKANEIKELRLDNWLLDGYGNYCQVKGIKRYGILLNNCEWLDGGNEFDLAEVSPILITEEILLSCGFLYRKSDKSRIYTLNGLMATYVFEGKFKGKRFLKYHNITYPEFGHIQHLHALQNFIYSLTGNESITSL